MSNRVNNSNQSIIFKILSNAIEQPRWIKIIGLILLDLVASICTLLIAIALRYGDFEPHVNPITVVLFASLPIVILALTHFYSNVLRVFQDQSMRVVLIVLLGCMLIGQLLIYFDELPDIPRAAPAIHVFLLYMWLWISRIIIQFLVNNILYENKHPKETQNVLVYGVGNITKDLLHVLQQSRKYQIVGIIDERKTLEGSRILGVKIYPKEKLRELIKTLDIEHLFLALPNDLKPLKDNIIHSLEDMPVQISQIPSLDDITSGKLQLSDIKPVDVLDVLQRETVAPNQQLLKKDISGKVVMVTGAGGSIGSELCRQIIKQQPKELILFELSEFALYTIQQELVKVIENQSGVNIALHAHLGSVTNQILLENICKKYLVETIYHAAAYKHVPIVESNQYEGAINNFIGTYRALQAAINTQVRTFVAISTDKAVRPTNVMGATKRMAELACQALAASQTITTISMVRFGNVLGSSGSVVPLFNRQLAAGGPLTVTHPDVTRYFMTIPEAAQLVIQAGSMAEGGEVFVLDMGESVKIVDLAKRMIRLSGHVVKGEDTDPNEGIAIEFVGLRPGEKLYEELIIGGDNIEKTGHSRIMKAHERSFNLAELEIFIQQLLEQNKYERDSYWLLERFAYFVEGYPKPKLANKVALQT
ncbi:nucleoside-diphosphate sugar epimerase/dehydratase [Moraxella osloensis]|nr:nucleoside-diphosphate sugar epimerase/dehydratase [Moraxella osloensis]MDK1669338.1 nucleoside-diphosphate sugar epimerase/dehydratase [Moraxella osloensis]